MSVLHVVPTLDEVEDRHPRLVAGLEWIPVEELALEWTKRPQPSLCRRRGQPGGRSCSRAVGLAIRLAACSSTPSEEPEPETPLTEKWVQRLAEPSVALRCCAHGAGAMKVSERRAP